MGLYNFNPRFVPCIESGRKTHTIRAKRRYADAVGSTLYLYTGLRQKGARLIRKTECTAVHEIIIYSENGGIAVDGVRLGSDECHALAVSDGFTSFSEMLLFWKGRLPFVGNIIHWS